MKQLHEYPAPETDAAIYMMDGIEPMVTADFARNLERRLAMCRGALDVAKDALDTAEVSLDPTYNMERQEIIAALKLARETLAATTP